MPHAAKRIREALEEIEMKRFFGIALTLVLFAAPAFASKKPPTVTIPAAVQVGSTQLPAGDSNHRPVLTSDFATPGDNRCDFSVDYQDSDGNCPVIHQVVVNGTSYPLAPAGHRYKQANRYNPRQAPYE